MTSPAPANKAELRQFIAREMPSVAFVTKDGLGTPVPAYLLEIRLPRDQLPTLEALIAPWGLKARWPICSEIYGAVRQIDVRPLAGEDLDSVTETPAPRRARP